jgi:hypothetical protein
MVDGGCSYLILDQIDLILGLWVKKVNLDWFQFMVVVT